MKFTARHLLILLLPLFLITGCATIGDCPPGDIACLEARRQENLEKWAARLQVLATEGVPLAYSQLTAPNRQNNFRNSIQQAVEGLRALAGPTLNLDQIILVMRQAGVTELADKDAQMYIASGRLLLSFVGIELSVTKPAEVELFRTALLSGLEAGQALLPPP